MASAADAVILDLEDAVAEDRKAEAREHVIAYLESRPAIRPEIAVRINPLNRVAGLEDLCRIGPAQVRAGAMC